MRSVEALNGDLGSEMQVSPTMCVWHPQANVFLAWLGPYQTRWLMRITWSAGKSITGSP
jgi:hypothetical protein